MTSRTLPAPWLRPVNTGVPALARDIVDAILDEIPDYRVIANPKIRAEAVRTVKDSLYTLLAQLASPLAPRLAGSTSALIETYRDLGRAEAAAGRTHDTLQSAYRIGSRILMRRLLDWEREFPIPVRRAADFANAAFQFVDDLAEYSAQGYLEAQGAGSGIDRERARLLSLLLDPRTDVSDAIVGRAERVGWSLPETATLMAVQELPDSDHGLAVARMARELFGPVALAGRFGGQDLIVVPEPPIAAELAALLGAHLPGVTLVVAFPNPLARLGESLTWIGRLTTLWEKGAVAGDRIITCDDNVLALLEDHTADVYDWLVAARLGPLLALSPLKRLKLARLMSAWLELGGVRGEVPGVLDKHRQTLRYQLGRIEELFGDQLNDRGTRLELMLALRRALPSWEAENRR